MMTAMVHDTLVVEVDVTTWTTEDGRKLKIVGMADSHLRNTVRFVMAKLSSMALADTPKDDHRRALRKMREMILSAKLTALQAEADRRGLQIENPS